MSLSPYDDPTANAQHVHTVVVRVLVGSIGFNVALLALLFYALLTIEISIPPDISSGAVVKRDQKEPTEVYGFSFNVFQQLFLWRDNGEVDYPNNIESHSHLITPSYKQYLIKDTKRRKELGELRNRLRNLQPVNAYSNDRIKVISKNNTWVVILDFNVREHLRGELIKNENFRYYIRVIRDHSDRINNPWGVGAGWLLPSP